MVPQSPTLKLPPPRTCQQAVVQARSALRTFRDAKAAGLLRSSQPANQRFWLSVELPIPVKRTILNPFIEGEGDLIRAYDESDWPGGMRQRFRSIKPQVDQLVEGYPDSGFLGLLESDADGVGLWSCGRDMTICGTVTTPTFPTFVKLMDGGFGSRVQDPDHTVITVNPQWGRAEEIGQIWERKLKRRATEIIGEVEEPSPSGVAESAQTSTSSPSGPSTEAQASSSSGSPWPRLRKWEMLYFCRIVRTSRGGTGLLHRAWPGPWRVYLAPKGDASEIGDLVLKADVRPTSKQLVDVLGARERWF